MNDDPVSPVMPLSYPDVVIFELFIRPRLYELRMERTDNGEDRGRHRRDGKGTDGRSHERPATYPQVSDEYDSGTTYGDTEKNGTT